ncbi:helix-turn-helix domain-containing protein [Lichenicoccus roseus]|uniref:helix-turn-helix domain-containing protein n=1 Tax=Lichenicoccus roseus TaxID=2683649 RepID=UPI0038D0639C
MIVRRRRAVILRTWRLQAGLTVGQVSEALGLHSTKLILALEEGLGDLGAQRVLRLARIYKVDHPLMLRVIRTGSAR